MRAWAERGYPAGQPLSVAAAARVRAVGWPLTVALALAAGALFCLHLDQPAFFDNEGRYAEVAREMLVRRDWITPNLDFALFLNKPPLTFWLTALVFQVAGPGEWGRLVPIAAAVVALVATGRLGALLYGEAVGLVAWLALASMVGFILEARTLRPDMILTAAVAVAMLCWLHARQDERRSTWWLAGLYAAIGVGALAKGAVVPIVVGLPVTLLTFQESGWRGLRALRPGLGLLVAGAIVLPWHVTVALEHPGFAWDYVVNQHLLFFLDKKVPRDSPGDPLWFFWAAYGGRALPWIVLLPATFAEALRGRTPPVAPGTQRGWRLTVAENPHPSPPRRARQIAATRAASPAARATFVLWCWVVAVLVLFSCAPSRLEHYALPALPATALLAARGCQRLRDGVAGWGPAVVAATVFVVSGVVLVVLGPRLVGAVYWINQVAALQHLVLPAGATVVGMGLLLALAASWRRAALVVVALSVGAVPLAAVVVRAQVTAEPLFSWRPVADALASGVPPDTEIVFEVPQEYQLVGALAFYTRRRITLVRPPGYAAPGYLVGHTESMFIQRSDLERRWTDGTPLALVSDPQRRRDSPAGLVPEPFRVVGRFGDRWVLANRAASPGS